MRKSVADLNFLRMLILILTSHLATAGIATTALAQSVTAKPQRISFKAGATSHEWRGAIHAGEKDFILRLGKSQTLKLESSEIYSWSVIGPDKRALACGGSADAGYCAPGVEIASLPLSGDYIVRTTYRMSDCATCPIATSRKVNVVFIAR